MKVTILSVCVLVLAFPSHTPNAQTAVPQSPVVSFDSAPPTAILKYGTLETGLIPDPQGDASGKRLRVVANDVEIQMGDNVLVADEAHIRYNAHGGLDAVELRGNVNLRAKLRVSN